jgi:hypothetical protein
MQKAVLILVLVLTSTSAYSTKIQQSIISSLNVSQLSLTQKCHLQFDEFFSNFTIDQYSWALQSKYRCSKVLFINSCIVVDATSKIPSGLWSLNFGEMGDFEQCVNIEASTKTGAILGKYCLGDLVVKNQEVPSLDHCECHLTVKFQMLEIISLDKFGTDRAMLPARLLWALCLPNECTTDDADLVGDFLLANVVGEEVSVRFSDLLCQTVKEVNPTLTNSAIVTLYVAHHQVVPFLSIFFQSDFSFVIINGRTLDSIRHILHILWAQ